MNVTVKVEKEKSLIKNWYLSGETLEVETETGQLFYINNCKGIKKKLFGKHYLTVHRLNINGELFALEFDIDGERHSLGKRNAPKLEERQFNLKQHRVVAKDGSIINRFSINNSFFVLEFVSPKKGELTGSVNDWKIMIYYRNTGENFDIFGVFWGDKKLPSFAENVSKN